MLQLYHLPPPLLPPVTEASCLFTRCQPPHASSCPASLYFSRYSAVRSKVFSVFFVLVFMHHLCEKYDNLRHCCMADGASWVPRLTLLNLRTNWTYKHAPGMEFVCMWGTGSDSHHHPGEMKENWISPPNSSKLNEEFLGFLKPEFTAVRKLDTPSIWLFLRVSDEDEETKSLSEDDRMLFSARNLLGGLHLYWKWGDPVENLHGSGG